KRWITCGYPWPELEGKGFGKEVVPLLEASSGLSNVHSDLGPFENVFDLADGVIISGKNVTEGMLEMAQATNVLMHTTLDGLRSENESLKSHYSLSCASYTSIFRTLVELRSWRLNYLCPKGANRSWMQVGAQEARDLLMANQFHLLIIIFRVKLNMMLEDWEIWTRSAFNEIKEFLEIAHEGLFQVLDQSMSTQIEIYVR
ncbi:hypothetical protein Tco_1255441, partial [Tanacetum coccineum]